MSSAIKMPEDKTPAPPSAEVQALLDLITATPSARLTVTHPTQTVSEPGAFIPKEDTKVGEPTLHFPGADVSKRYVVIMTDPDAPAMFGTVVHWIQSGLCADAAGKLSSSNEPWIANYRGANPPPDSKPHRYIFAVYEQPAGFDYAKHAPRDGAEMDIMARINTDYKTLLAKLGLGELLAGNFYTSL